MRRTFLLSLLVLLSCTLVHAQRGRGPSLIGVWNETSFDRYGKPVRPEYQRNRNLLILDADGYFEEVRPDARYAETQRFFGRWEADYRFGDLNLLVETDRPIAYRPRGYRTVQTTQRIPYAIVYSDRDELILRDRRNGRKRVFVRTREPRY